MLSAFSFPVAAWISRRIGLINIMVFTHIPSSLCLILAAVAPSLEAALMMEDRQQVILLETHDHAEAVAAFRERRDPSYSDQ